MIMNDFNSYQEDAKNKTNSEHDYFTTKILIPFGSIIIAAIGILASTNKIPFWAFLAMAIYILLLMMIILFRPIKNITMNFKGKLDKKRFIKHMNPELKGLSKELNKLLDFDRTNTIPYFVKEFSSKIADIPEMQICLEKNRQQFMILQSWSHSISKCIDDIKSENFVQNASQMSDMIGWFTWASEWFRQGIQNIEDFRACYKRAYIGLEYCGK